MIITNINRVNKELAFLFISMMVLENYAVAKQSFDRVETIALSPRKNSGTKAEYSPASFRKDPAQNYAYASPVFGTAASPKAVSSPRKVEIGGPGQPEMQSFQATGVSNMVDLFSGDFSYNIPLMDVGGYPVNIHYNSGISMDQDASWVGLGWNINPGTISRNMRGLPDDFNGKDTVTKTFNMKKNVTVGVTGDLNPEVVGKEIKLASVSTSLEYNNYSGIGLSFGISPTINSGKFAAGNLTAGLNDIEFALGSKTGVDIRANFSSHLDKKVGNINGFTSTLGLNYNSRRGLDLQLTTGTYYTKHDGQKNRHAHFPLSSFLSFARTSYTPTIQVPFSSFQFSFRGKFGPAIFAFHPTITLGGFYSEQGIAVEDRVQKLPAFGYLHYQDANDQQQVLLDYNRESDNTYSKNLPHISIPVYTHDLFTVSGEGNGGMFRPYRGDVGYIRDAKMRSKSHSGGASVDFGGGAVLHGGVDLTYNYSYTETNEWVKQNSLRGTLRFRNADTTFESVYFRNPGEKTVNARVYYDAVGGDDLIRVKLGAGTITPQATNNFSRYNEQKKEYAASSITSTTVKRERDKRTQVFTYLSAAEAGLVGLDSLISIYPENKFFAGNCDSIDCIDMQCDTIQRESRINEYRKAHHISEVVVLNPDGKRYVYGIPAYNTKQTEVTFAVNKDGGNLSTGLVDYTPGLDDNTTNNKGKDNFFSSEELPPYAHSYLLTGLVSADYVDVKGDGISDDDIGDAVKFNYSRIFSKQNPYKWRAPFNSNKASYSENLRTDKSDDKGHYTYGEKEVWYLNSIESKTMIATFTLNAASAPRHDGRGVTGKHGARDDNQKLRYLKRIDLYSKADFIKNGTSAKPIKTVHFAYSYKLCEGNPGSSHIDTGKLTLDTIWFSYNGNNKGKKNPYVFSYHENNPNYNNRNVDRWGVYKNAAVNPGAMSNAEFPYAHQDSAVAAANAGAWTLQSIKLPSGGRISVDYESDDYGYVQNRRATQMFRIAGFSSNAGAAWSSINNTLYNGLQDQYYMYVELPATVSSRKEFYEKYLKGLQDKLYFRAAVQIPSDTYGSGQEFVSGYCGWEDYNVVEAGATTKAWIKLKQVKSMSPVTKAALQFLRLNLPSKAYPGSDVKNDLGPAAMIKVLGSFGSSIFQLLTTFDGSSKLRGWCKTVDLSKSIVRLANPVYKKMGGGIRVKRVLIYDNWNAMSGQKESFYGQEYNYTTVEEIDGKKTLISSGVATYEPTIGNDENPFHVAMEYTEQSSILAPTFGRYIDNPVGESFYPSPSVGYSKVRVASIKRKNVKSGTGYEESEFYTAREFPVLSDFTPLDRDSKRQFRSPLRFFLRIDLRQHLTMTQGFRVQLNDMHGKMKSKTVFGENDTLNPISYVKNFYRVENPNSPIQKLKNKVAVVETTSGAINTDAEIGKDVELMVDMRQQVSETWGVNVEINNDFFIIPTIIPIPVNLPSWIPVPNHDLKQFRSVTVMKIVSRYGILDSVVQIEKGSKVSVKNLLYDAETGDVVLSRTQNEFDDPVYNFSYPAYQAYDALGLAYKNVGAMFKDMSITNGRLSNTYYDKFFTGGDEILVTAGPGTKLCGSGYSYDSVQGIKLWAIEGVKIGKSNGMYFIDRTGKLFTSNMGTIKILRSGRRNLLGEVGSIVSLANPIVPDGSGGQKLLFDNATNVLNASVAEYKENWKVEDRFGTYDSIVQTISPTKNSKAIFYPNDAFIMKLNGNVDVIFKGNNSNTFEAKYRFITDGPNHSETIRSWLRFNLPDSLVTKEVVSAKLYLIADTTNHPGNHSAFQAHRNNHPSNTNTNASYIKRDTNATWINSGMSDGLLINLFGGNKLDNTIQANLSAAPASGPGTSNQNEAADVKGMVEAMLESKSTITNQVFYIQIANTAATDQADWNRRCYFSNINYTQPEDCGQFKVPCPEVTRLEVEFLACWEGSGTVTFIEEGPEGPGYYCYKQDTIQLCKSLLTKLPSNPYVMGYLGNWRPYRSYTYYDERKETDPDPAVLTNIRTDGTFKTFSPFWSYTSGGLAAVYDSSKWVWNSEITKINRKGMEVENKDPLGRYNAGLYGYNLTLPVAVVQNSQYKEIAFDGFEDYGFKNDLCAKPCSTFNHFDLPINIEANLSTAEKHSGKYSLKVNQNGSFGIVTEIKLIRPFWDTIPMTRVVQTDTNRVVINANQTNTYCFDAVHTDSTSLLPRYSPVPGSTVVVGAWVKEAKDCNCESYTENSISVIFRQTNGSEVTYTLKPSGNIIEGWQRVDSVISVPANTVAYRVLFNASPSSITYFDDFRIQPFNSNMKSFVYNPVNLRLMAELDENNYATFYEYDDDGTLIRVKKETVRGIKTIKETRSALLKQ